MALRIASPFDWHAIICWTYLSLAALFNDEGESDDANANIERSKLHAANNPLQLGDAMVLQAYVWSRQLRLEDAKSEVSDVLEIFEKLRAVEDMRRCQCFLQKVE
jgi:hypothetical protein